MKKIFFVLLFIPLLGFGQVKINGATVNVASDGTLTSGDATNYVQIGKTEGIKLAGTATQWNDFVVTATATKINPATSLPAYSVDSIAILLVRDPDSSEVLVYNLQMSHSVVYGADKKCNPHFHYVQFAAADSTFEAVLYYRIYKVGQQAGTWQRLTPVSRAYLTFTAAPFHQICEFADIPLVNVSESSLIDFRLFRKDAAGNPATLYLKSYDVHFEYDKIGTTDEYPSH